MGYDNDECVWCYMNGGGNNSDCDTHIVCLVCMNEMTEDGGCSSRFTSGLKSFLESGVGKCHLCNRECCVWFEAPLCSEHTDEDIYQ